MKTTLETGVLRSAFATAASVTPRNPQKECLSCVKMTIEDGSAKLFSTNLETGLAIDVPTFVGGVDSPGQCLLPASKFADLLRVSSASEVSISLDETALVVTSGRSKFRFGIIDHEEYPSAHEVSPASVPHYEVSAGGLATAMRRTVFADDMGNDRYALAGVLFVFEDAAIRLVATDGRRLAMATAAAVNVDGMQSPDGRSLVLPDAAARTLLKTMSDVADDTPVSIFVADAGNVIYFVGPRFALSSRLIEGRFPKWQDVIPTNKSNQLSLRAGELADTVQQASIVASKESRGVNIAFSDDAMTITAATENGESDVQMLLPNESRAKWPTVTLDFGYLVEFLRTIKRDESVTMHIRDSRAPVVFSYGNSTYLVMPMDREEKKAVKVDDDGDDDGRESDE